MDCQMPVMDGFTATREIRANPAFAKLPIIAMTANVMAGDRDKAIAAGMCDLVAKPLNIGLMFLTIAKWMQPEAALVARRQPVSAQSAATEERSAGSLQSLPGLDVTAGLATTMNNERVYRRLLISFRDSQDRFDENFAAAQADCASDSAAAERVAHTLKGNAGNIGAFAVQATAGALERACHERASVDRITELVRATTAELALVLAGLRKIADEPGAASMRSAKASVPSTEKLDAGIRRLKLLLAVSDSEAVELVDELLATAHGTDLALALTQAAKALASFDFDVALDALSGAPG